MAILKTAFQINHFWLYFLSSFQEENNGSLSKFFHVFLRCGFFSSEVSVISASLKLSILFERFVKIVQRESVPWTLFFFWWIYLHFLVYTLIQWLFRGEGKFCVLTSPSLNRKLSFKIHLTFLNLWENLKYQCYDILFIYLTLVLQYIFWYYSCPSVFIFLFLVFT